MKDARFFVLFWVLNSTLLYLVPYVFPSFMVVGNARLTPFLASIISGFLLAAADAMVYPILKSLRIRLTQDWQWFGAYLITNILAVWLLARYADLTGVGIASLTIAVVFGGVINTIQWFTWKYVDKGTKRK